jgi:hypothetical protein
VLARRVEVWIDTLVLPPALAAMLAFADELLVLPEWDAWRRPGGCESAVAYLLPLAEAARLGEL